jgi:hypothetical protein
MEPTESRTHSFIIKIWLEEETDESGRMVWRGHITHVPGGERQYIQDLSAISSFIRPYLGLLGERSDSTRINDSTNGDD